MGNRLSFLNSGFKMGLLSTAMFETCSVISQSSGEAPHKRFLIEDVKLIKLFNGAMVCYRPHSCGLPWLVVALLVGC